MTLQNLSHRIELGEGTFLEFKNRVPAPERIAKEVVAFANTRGGTLLLGVEDDGTVIGVKDAAEEEFALEQALRRHARPVPAIEAERVRVSRKRDVIVVTVRESDRKPHYVVVKRSRTAYVRVDDKSLEASGEAIGLMRKKTGDVLFEIREKERLLLKYLDLYGRISVTQFARLAGISRRTASRTLVLLTRADVLAHHLDVNEDYFTHGKAMAL